MVTVAGRYLRGRAKHADWNEALIAYVRRRPQDDRSLDEGGLVYACRAVVDKWDHEPGIPRLPDGQDATMFRYFVSNPFSTSPKESRDGHVRR
jgi:hypothetical protein